MNYLRQEPVFSGEEGPPDICGKEKVRKGSTENSLKWQHSKNTYVCFFPINCKLWSLLKKQTKSQTNKKMPTFAC